MPHYEATIIAERIKQLLKAKKTPASKMLIECNINKDALNTMHSKGYLPRLDAIARIADYLDVSVDYLLGRTDNPNSHKN